MTKTEQMLIAEATKRGGTYAIDSISGRGAFGGKVQAGIRERNALFKLAERGIVTIVQRHNSVDHNRGYAVWTNTFVFSLV